MRATFLFTLFLPCLNLAAFHAHAAQSKTKLEPTVNTTSASTKKSENTQVVEVTVTEQGFEPNQIQAKPGVPVLLRVTRKAEVTCATEIEVPKMKISKKLPLNQTVEVKLGKLEKGEIRFGCGMRMMIGGKIFVM